MKEKTLRYPGHVEYVRFKRNGFFDTDTININNIKLDFTSKMLLKNGS